MVATRTRKNVHDCIHEPGKSIIFTVYACCAGGRCATTRVVQPRPSADDDSPVVRNDPNTPAKRNQSPERKTGTVVD